MTDTDPKPRVFDVKMIARNLLKPIIIAGWLSLLLLPFMGIRTAILFLLILFGLLIGWEIFLRFQGTLRLAFKRIAWHMPEARVLSRKQVIVAGCAALLAACMPPLFLQDYFLDVAILVGIYIILALGLNVVVGFAGLLNLGFVAFYALGAYAYALLNTKCGMGFWTALPFSVGLSVLAGFLLAIPALRLRGDYLAIVTLGFGEITRLILNNWDSLTMGPNGISGISAPVFLSLSLEELSFFYYLVLFFVLFTLIVTMRVRSSRIGRAWIAIREDEIASSTMGINTTGYKLYAIAFGAFWAGLAGALFAAKMRFVSPESFTFMESVIILCMVILGGLGSIWGVILGACILVLLPEILREIQTYRMLALGAGLVLLMVFRPRGLFGGRSVSLRN